MRLIISLMSDFLTILAFYTFIFWANNDKEY